MATTMTNTENDTSPRFEARAFKCPHCHKVATQEWLSEVDIDGHSKYAFLNTSKFGFARKIFRGYALAECLHCEKLSFWAKEEMVYPLTPSAPVPHKDMPDSVKDIYEEARLVEPYSPRAAAALLRVSLEKLTEELGETKGNLHTRISNLKEKGLPVRVIKALHVVRITGNDAVHSGQIDLNNEDNPEIVRKLFRIVNLIVEKTIGDEKEIKEIFDAIPENKKQGLEDHNNSN